MSLDSISLQDLENLRVPGAADLVARQIAASLEDFLAVLYRDIDRILRQMEQNPQHRHQDSEDRITAEIVTNLNTAGYEFASHDTAYGGHVDILVQHKGFRWLGEAKIVSGNNVAYLWEGYLQLMTRYSAGNNSESGGILIYIKRGMTTDVMEAWRKYIADQHSAGQCETTICSINGLAFYSHHAKHPRSGLPYRIRHIPLNLVFEPKDKSGRIKAAKS